MTYLCVDKNGSEWAFDGPPNRTEKSWTMSYDATSCVELPKGSIESLRKEINLEK